MIAICNANGYIKPTAYQGIYNAVHRQAFNLSLRLISTSHKVISLLETWSQNYFHA